MIYNRIACPKSYVIQRFHCIYQCLQSLLKSIFPLLCVSLQIMGDQQQMQTAETSAKTGSNVEDVFMKLAREIYDSGIINSAAGGADASGEVVHIR